MAPKPTSSGNLAPRASWGRSILVHFGVHFEVPNRSKNDTENKLIFKRFWGALEIRDPGFFTLTWLALGLGGGLIGGGNQSHRINVSTYQGFKDSWYQSINITRTLGDKRLRFYACHRFYQRSPLSLVTPTRGVGGLREAHQTHV